MYFQSIFPCRPVDCEGSPKRRGKKAAPILKATLQWIERKLRKWVLSDFCWQEIPNNEGALAECSSRMGGLKVWTWSQETKAGIFTALGAVGLLVVLAQVWLSVGKAVIEIYWLIGATWQIRGIYARRSLMELTFFIGDWWKTTFHFGEPMSTNNRSELNRKAGWRQMN